jgi:uncharacterized protein YndB with AHSA1/START domain
MGKNISQVTINAPVSKVWDVITRPEMVKQWQYGSDLTTDWQVGSGIRFPSKRQGNVYEQWGKVLEVVPHSLVRYSLFAPRPGLEDVPENYFVMTYTLTEQGDDTILTIEMNDNRPGTSDEESVDEDGQSILTMLKSVAEAS